MKNQMKDVRRDLKGPGLQFAVVIALFLIAIIVVFIAPAFRSKNIHGLPTEVAPTTAATPSHR